MEENFNENAEEMTDDGVTNSETVEDIAREKVEEKEIAAPEKMNWRTRLESEGRMARV